MDNNKKKALVKKPCVFFSSQLRHVDVRKWIASRFHPRQFSEKLMHDAKLGDMESSKLHLLELKKEMERASDDAG